MKDHASLIVMPLWELQQTDQLQNLLIATFWRMASQFGLYVLVSFFAAISFSPQKTQGVSLRAYLLAIVFGAVLSAAITTIGSMGFKPSVVGMLVPLLGCLTGAWLGCSWAAGGQARKRIWLKLTLFTGMVVIAAAVLVNLAISRSPLPFEAQSVSSDDRTRLVDLIRSKTPGSIPENQTVTLTLSEHDLNLLLAWGLSLGSSDRKGRVLLDEQQITIDGSIGFPFAGGSRRYVNFSVAGWASVNSGQVDGQLQQLTIGSIRLPALLLRILSSAILSEIVNEPLFEPILAEITETQINPDYTSITYQKIEMPSGLRDKIFASMGSAEAMRESLLAQFNVIRATSNSLPRRSQADLGVFMRASFALAHQRSESGDPVLENRAAIMALSIAMGHRTLARLISDMPYKAIPSIRQQVTLRQRKDWTRHFLISAALEVVSSESISLDIGILKEELDTRKGGSGFSFADLAADRSGTMFAKVATQDNDAAELIQARIIQRFSVGDYIPPISDLPENISAEHFASHYGGTDGEPYKRLVREIDRRIAQCDAYL